MQNLLRQTRLLDPFDIESPARGDEIALVGADEKPNGLYSRVYTLEASDRESGMYEIHDDRKVNLIITRAAGDTWLQVLIPR